MFRITVRYSVSTLLFFMASNTFAQTSPYDYYGISYNQTAISENTVPSEVDSTAAIITVGRVNEQGVSLEIRLGQGLNNEPLGTPADVDVGLDSIVGIYYKLYGEPSSLVTYLIIGYSRVGVVVETAGVSVLAEENDFSYGIGMDYNITEEFVINFEYINYYDDENFSVEALGLGFLMRY